MGDALSIEDREGRIVQIDERIAEIDKDYDGQRMPDTIRDEWNGLNAERDEHLETLKELRARRERIANLARSNPQATERVNGDGDTPVVIRRRGTEIYDLARIRAESRSDDDYRARLHDNAKRAIEQANYGPVRAIATKEDLQTNVLRLLDGIDDEDGTLAKRILATGSPEYERWFWAQIAGRSDVPRPQAALTLSGTSIAVPFTLDPTVILTSDGATNPLRTMARVETITGRRAWEGITSAGITVGRLGEALASTDNAPTLAQPTVTPTTVRGFVPFSIESDQDWTQLRSEMTRLLMDAKDVEEASAFVVGSGVAPAAAGIQATLSTSANVGDQVTFTVNSLTAADNALPPRYAPRAQWLARKNIYNLIRTLDSNGTLYVRLTDGRPPELLGYPAREASTMPTVRFTASTIFGARYAILGDFSQFIIVDSAGMDIEIIPHLFGAAQGNLPTGQRAIFALWRNNSKVLNDNAFRILVYQT
jgi:HK97 family phage major capsid protein